MATRSERSTTRVELALLALLQAPRGCASTASVPLCVPPPRVLVFGLGFTGCAIARELEEKHGCKVVGTRRRGGDGAGAWRGAAVEFAGEGSLSAEACDALARATHVISTIPPTDAGADPVLQLAGGLLRARIDAGELRWLGYLSSTSVYGDHQGAWVDEASATRAPPSSSAHARLAVETEWRSLAHGAGSRGDGRRGAAAARVAVFRLAGIYGPGRSALDTAARARAEAGGDVTGTSYAAGDGTPVSRVHVDDIAGAVGAALVASVGGTFNVADHRPAPRADVFAFCEGLLQAAQPAPASASAQRPGTRAPGGAAGAPRALSERSRRRGSESKRVCGDKLRREVGYAFVHPDYMSGLTAIHAAVTVSAAGADRDLPRPAGPAL
ncbi:hypothetical protein KFE25_001335 [Diacronema lutheri]|uniref:NAD-dependent epimerase/dehydratase domain-containing protein n=1 Tax=Diacronema lutheri TaxID=2081491 RepID=A0A8J5XIF4_DIALT|nr:hypothetical protein KFE25_001335 [Diacronema lutheri]